MEIQLSRDLSPLHVSVTTAIVTLLVIASIFLPWSKLARHLLRYPFSPTKNSGTHLTISEGFLDGANTLKWTETNSETQGAIEVGKESDFPDDWWTSEELFGLEKRAIFAKSWVRLSHTIRFPVPGTYTTIEHPSGYPLFLILGRDGILRGFHNVCRHRAFPVISSKQSGCSLVLGCRYHGWSYDSKGRLVKAPKFDGIKGFDKERNGLFEVKVRIGADGGVEMKVAGGEMSDDSVSRKTMRPEGRMIESWEVEGQFNWKLAESPSVFDIPSLIMAGSPESTLARLLAVTGLRRNPVHIRPSLLTHVISSPAANLNLMINIMPISAKKNTVRCSLYTITAAPIDTTVAEAAKRDVAQSVQELEMTYSRIKGAAAIHDLSSQTLILSRLKTHWRQERLAGEEIRPVARQTAETSQAFRVAQNLCKELEAATDGVESSTKAGMKRLDW